jgi:hypothetical protein
MMLKNFEDYLTSRLNKSEIAELKQQTEMEFEALAMLQKDSGESCAEH